MHFYFPLSPALALTLSPLEEVFPLSLLLFVSFVLHFVRRSSFALLPLPPLFPSLVLFFFLLLTYIYLFEL